MERAPPAAMAVGGPSRPGARETSSMIDLGNAMVGRFCWVDLAATDAARATDFYAQPNTWA